MGGDGRGEERREGWIEGGEWTGSDQVHGITKFRNVLYSHLS